MQVELSGFDCVVISRNRIGDNIRIAIRIDDSDRGDTELGSVRHNLVFIVFCPDFGMKHDDDVRKTDFPFKSHLRGGEYLSFPGTAVRVFLTFDGRPLYQVHHLRLSTDE